MSARERGFTLLEIVVAVAVAAMLLAAGLWAMAEHPASLAAATGGLDGALAAARSIAASSGNGATLVFAPRSASSGFSLRVYRGRPNAAGAVAATTFGQVISDVAIRERTLGAVPFALFLDSAGNASGSAQYPSFDPGGSPIFSTISREPPCPAGGFVLTLTSPQSSATVTRMLPCAASAGVVIPGVSPTPNVPIVTPSALLFHWPGDTQQQFVATEWGYTHWFAATSGFACGASVAQYPNVLPSPYSAPANAGEAQLPPSPPPQVPFSYPNSGGESMNDAPALFLLEPQSGGICDAAVQDDYGQDATASVVVMGWLAASYQGATATHGSPALAIPESALPKAGSSVTLSLAKTFDAQPLEPQVAFTGSSASACTNDLVVASANGVTPATPSPSAATASLTLTVAALPPALLACAGVIYNHYSDANAPSDATSEAGEGVAFSAAIGPEAAPLSAWPSGVVYAQNGQTIADGCHAIAYRDAALTQIDANDATYATFGAATDASGCYNGAIVVSENGYTGDFTATPSGCNASVTLGTWSPANAPIAALSVSGGSPAIVQCALDVSSSDENASNDGARSVAIAVDSCSGNGAIVSVGSGCEFQVRSGPNPRDCVIGAGYEGAYYEGTIAQNPTLGTLSLLSATSSGGGPTTYTYLWTRTSTGTETITIVENEAICTSEGQFEPGGSSTTTVTLG
jgi:prepilin-type N-terminal cleavage/methylation domain-containing protein